VPASPIFFSLVHVFSHVVPASACPVENARIERAWEPTFEPLWEPGDPSTRNAVANQLVQTWPITCKKQYCEEPNSP
jgi:hypothetical protein